MAARFSTTCCAWQTLSFILAWGAETIPPGVPEPGLVIWGSVVNRTNPAQAVSIQSASWTVTDGTKTAVFSGTSRPAVRVMELAGQSYYVLEVPFDTRRLGAVTLSDPATVGLDSFELKAASPPTYLLTPTINGALATVQSINGAPAPGDEAPVTGFTASTRGRAIRVDLAITPPADSYNSWAAQKFGDANLPQAARAADPDGDGLANEAEFLAGTDPQDASSALRILAIALDAQSKQAVVHWQSISGKNYMIQAAAGIDGAWGDVGPALPGAADLTQAQINFPDGGENLFFRVRLVP